jgi:hypothetical protein
MYANSSAAREYGWSPEELAGRMVDVITSSPF